LVDGGGICVLEPTDCVRVARRRFILLKARREPERNFLGLDIRAKLVDRSNLWSDEVGVQSNVHFHFANATIALSSLLANYPGQVDCVSIQVRALLDVHCP
jgi:tRNA G46 methylase TrmB